MSVFVCSGRSLPIVAPVVVGQTIPEFEFRNRKPIYFLAIDEHDRGRAQAQFVGQGYPILDVLIRFRRLHVSKEPLHIEPERFAHFCGIKTRQQYLGPLSAVDFVVCLPEPFVAALQEGGVGQPCRQTRIVVGGLFRDPRVAGRVQREMLVDDLEVAVEHRTHLLFQIAPIRLHDPHSKSLNTTQNRLGPGGG